MPKRPVQAVIMHNEYEQFPKEAPGFTADVNSLQDLWDAVHRQPGVSDGATLLIQVQNAAGITWFQRWADTEELPAEEADPIKIKVIREQTPGTARTAADKKGGAGEKAKPAHLAGKKDGIAPTGEGDASPAPEPGTPLGREGSGRDVGRAAKHGEGAGDVDLVRYHLKKIDKQMMVEGAVLDRVEEQMLERDSYDNERKSVMLTRIQDRLAATLTTLHQQRTTILVAALGAEGEGGVEVDYEKAAEGAVYTAHEDEDDDDVVDDDLIRRVP